MLIPVRIIVRGDDVGFGEEVTKTNNRQNRIEHRDFVALDPEQTRLRSELAIDGIDYQVVRNESVTRTPVSFDLVDATTALACASGKVRLVVQLKREIGKLWEDVSKAPYKELFNSDVPGLYAWRCVQIQRRIDEALETRHKRPASSNSKRKPIGTHGKAQVVPGKLAIATFARGQDPGHRVPDAGRCAFFLDWPKWARFTGGSMNNPAASGGVSNIQTEKPLVASHGELNPKRFK